MLIQIEESDPRPIYQQIVDEIRRAVVVGTVGAGEALPSVRQLAGELRVNPNTVQQAYRELERAGLAYVRRGQGTYVSELANGEAERERAQVAEAVARRAVGDARRHGLTVSELMAAVDAVVGQAAESVERSEGA